MDSFQDVFKEFEYELENDDDSNADESFFHETFSQLKKVQPVPSTEIKTTRASSRRSKVDLADFEEAFTVLKSIQSAHEPSSLTSITAFLHYRRRLQTNRRTLKGLLWPEHPETFSSSRLIESSLAETANLPGNAEGVIEEPETIPQLYTEPNSDTSDNEDSAHATHHTPCEMSQSKALHKALVRTCQSIWRQKNALKNPSTEISPHLSHVISRRCSFLLQTVFKRAHLNRRSAVKLLQNFKEDCNRDWDNVPVDWIDVKEASKQNVTQASLDQETFLKFKTRIEKLFKKH